MSVVVVGLHERDASLELLEQATVQERDLAKVLRSLSDSPNLSEVVVLSTCMRTEVYAVAERFHDGLSDIESFFESRFAAFSSGPSPLQDQLSVSFENAAAEHLFEVAAGLDSAVLGEGEILRQVRQASERAREERTLGPVLGGLFRHAIEAGKRVRSETAIARGITSLSHVAVAVVREQFASGMTGKRLLVVGAGEMSEGMADALASQDGALEVVVADRTLHRAEKLAERVGGRAIALSALNEEVVDVDVLLTATAAEHAVLGLDDLKIVMEKRKGRPLVIVDAAVPRDIDPAIGELDGVTLKDLGDLRAFADREMQSRKDEVGRVEEIISDELDRYHAYARSRGVTPLITALRQRAEEFRAAEVERVTSRLGDSHREVLDEITTRLVAKLLHEPTTQVKDAAGTPRGERFAEALRALFDL